MEFFDKIVRNYTRNLLSRISLDFNIPIEELEMKFMEKKKPAKIKVVKVIEPAQLCVFITGKKTQCTRKCISGTTACGLHSRPKKEKEIQLVVVAPFIREDDPGPSMSIDDRIRAILSGQDDEEEVLVKEEEELEEELEEEPDSPGGFRHATFLKYKEKGVTWESYHSVQWQPHQETLEQRLQFLSDGLSA